MKLNFVALFGVFFMNFAHATPTPHESLLVLSKGNHTLSIVDPVSLKVVARAPVGDDPHEVISSTDGKFAYVSNYGGGSLHTLTVIDLIAQKNISEIELGALKGPHGLVYVGDKVWFTAEGSKAIGSYDPKTKSIDWILGIGQDRTHMIYVSDDAKKVYTTNVSSATVSIIEKITKPGFAGGPPPGQKPPKDSGRKGHIHHPPPGAGGAREDWQETVVEVGHGSEGFDVSPNAKELWTANAEDGTVSVIDLSQKKVVATLKANVPGANRLKFSPDGKLVLISSLRDGELTILDASTRKEVKRIDMGGGSAGIQMQADGTRAYVASTEGDAINVIDLESLKIVGKIDAGPEPDGLAWSVIR